MKFLFSFIAIFTTFTQSTACLGADATNNLYLFGTPRGDFAISTLASAAEWTQLSPSTNRPDFNVQKGTQCHFAQYSNALVVVNGNSQDSMIISSYFYGNNSWAQTRATGSVE